MAALGAKYQQYAEYKDSGVEWLGEIPTKWKVTALKRYCNVKGGYAFASDTFSNAGEPVIRIGDIKADGSISLEGCKFISTELAKSSHAYLVEKGQLLMAMTGATIGKAGVYINDRPAYLNQRVGKFVIDNDEMNYSFLWYTLKTNGYQEYIKLTAFGGAQPNISDTGMVDYISCFPSLIEQTQIANFLDFETAQIDTLIEKQQTLIQLLKEKRQAVISHAVTKGLNPDVPMKDSGVEWLGGIPSHWNMQKLKYVGEAKNGLTYSPDNVTEAGIGTLVLRSSNIQNAQLSFEDNVYVDMKIPERILVRTDDILICSRNGSRRLIGKNALITEDVAGQAFGAFMVVFRSEINTYLYWILNSPLFEYQSGSFLTSTINQLTIGNLHSMEIPIPPKKEQDEIEKYLKTKMIDFDKLISKAEQAIQLMQERRTALISAAVTGKIDVRGWRAAE
ncbi:MAG: restriction endonuclease subunit S [Psychrobacter pacificensis]|uniref:restriction endonuclease subunit S n=1 Tax=Psychrobacter pacificensis TaxID=112002 RepID=UPI00238A2F9F|nr:restriction endonuclease subunit S [Psychrobacter pacificensis]MDE0842647.1 restriction endonuclease subunit S [Psychrobacter pacificensis]